MKVRVSHLKDGHHSLSFAEMPAQFNLAGMYAFKDKLNVTLEIEKRSETLYVRQMLSTAIAVVCDRCLETYTEQIESEFLVVYTAARDLLQYDDELRYLAPDQGEIDITEDVKASMILAVPAKLVCSESCKGLCPECGANLNRESCTCSAPQADPRWDALKDLLK